MRYLFPCFFFLLFVFRPFDNFSQSSENGYFTIGAGTGILSFAGDLDNNSVSSQNNYKAGFHINLEKRISSTFGLAGKALIGKVSQNEIAFNKHRNFESKISQQELSIILYLDNDLILSKKSLIAPYFSAGVGYFTFDPHGDLLDAKGNIYYYWSDGYIRNLPENALNANEARRLSRDYTFETQLTDSTENYKRSSISFPVSAGLSIKLMHGLEARFSATYYFSQTDRIDNLALNGNNDKFIYTAFSINYTFGKTNVENSRYKDVNFNGLIIEDNDHDGVKDINDRCQNTPDGVAVDEDGCPVDKDQDGVPDYLDQEPDTPRGTPVDSDGVALTDEKIEEQFNIMEYGKVRTVTTNH